MIFNFKDTTDAKTLDGHGAEYFAPLENLGGAKILTELPEGITTSNTMQELIDALPNTSIFAKGRMNGFAPKGYSELVIFKHTNEHVLALAKSQYDNFITVGGCGTNGKWQGWQEVFTTAGGTLTNHLLIKKSDGAEVRYQLDNGVRSGHFVVSGDQIGLYESKEGWIAVRDSSGTIFRGRATENLPLTGGTVTGDFKVKRIGGIGYFEIYKNHSSAVDYGTQLTDRNQNNEYSMITVSASANEPTYTNKAGVTSRLLHTGNSAKTIIDSVAPSDTSALWIDTSA